MKNVQSEVQDVAKELLRNSINATNEIELIGGVLQAIDKLSLLEYDPKLQEKSFAYDIMFNLN